MVQGKQMTTTSDVAVTEICSVIEYLLDRGEIEHFESAMTYVRYTNNIVNTADFIVDGRLIRISAEDLGAHQHIPDEEYTDICATCGGSLYDE
jgi:hypothetical protein